MALGSVRSAETPPARGAKSIEPIAGDIYADHDCRRHHITLSSLCCAVPQTGRRQLFETVRRDGISLLAIVVGPQGVQRCIPPIEAPGREPRWA